MKFSTRSLLLTFVLMLSTSFIHGQCANSANIFTFTYNGHTYEFVSENRNWATAAACAVERGGYLVEINDMAEDQEIFNQIDTNLPAVNEFWIGASDAGTEGTWIWDGDNDGIGPQFWQGDGTGSATGGLFNNWGIHPTNAPTDSEPDDFGAGQDGAQMWMNDFCCGSAGQWNDWYVSNLNFYLIEHDNLLGIEDDRMRGIKIYPNPMSDFINVDSQNATITSINIVDLLGKTVLSYANINGPSTTMDVSGLPKGIYFLELTSAEGQTITRKMVK